ncbi:WD40 repeat-like protein [Venustampulla echinocandica]|uniref:WD40 repeat-like protein n=1 Tax=Venustampulla echinocandica TaxID=2656787 RepID=A0A370TVW0_9HELO|nr:WD40 repeat-like protein [Venustampulla echinocandica]RDL39664.1 WD40 repeat-like protein [Venustampulla echinocandica]
MDPPARPASQRRAAMVQNSSPVIPQKYTSDGSPCPFVSKPKPTHISTDVRRPSSRSQTVSIGWEDDTNTTLGRASRLQIELAECVETKTVTTTTTTKRSYPPLLIQQKSLETLDAKEYPLASKPTPAELTKISYDVDVQSGRLFGGSPTPNRRKTPRLNISPYTQISSERMDGQEGFGHERGLESGALETPELHRAERPRKRLPSMNHPERSTRGDTEVQSRSPKSSVKGRKFLREVDRKIRDGQLEMPEESRTRHHGLGVHLSKHTSFPETPEMSELESSMIDRTGLYSSSFGTNAYTPKSGMSQNDSFEDIANPPDAEESFANAVATPPIAESDLEPLDGADVGFANLSGQRPNVNTAAAQNASLPSPGLSPTFASAELDHGEFPLPGSTEDDELAAVSPTTQSGDSQQTLEDDDMLGALQRRIQESPDQAHRPAPSIMDTRSMLETFDSMPNDMKTLMMYQLLRRCSKKTLHVLTDVIGPALKCDFFEQLPVELSLHILSFLDHRDLCRAAQVSKHWRNVIDTNETGWKELFDRDGFVLPSGELERAIRGGWGWQDPYGPDAGEEDLSLQYGSSFDGDISTLGGIKVEEATRKIRSTATKRKRATGGSGSDRAKRRAVGTSDKANSMSRSTNSVGFHKSEGPLSAATAAALAIPDPQLGLPGLRKLHLFKSLYRRHYMLRNSWLNPNVAPHHFAFPAHPAHVITCLQFDDDKIITGSDDALIHVYDTKTGALRKRLEGHEGGVWALQYEGNVLVSGSTDRSVRVWDIEKGLCTQVFHGHTSTVRCLQILMPELTGKTEKGKPIMVPEKPLIITGSRDSQLRVWRLPEQGSKRYIQTGPPVNDQDCPYFVRVLAGHAHSVRAIAAHQDTLVSGSYDNTVRVWKISTGETLHRLTGHSMKVYSVVLDHKRNRCISGSMDNFVKIWSLETGSCLFTLEGHTSLVGLLDLQDERLVSAAADSTLRIWDPKNGLCKSSLTAHTGAITCFQHDGQKVISGSDRTLKMWNIKTGECMKDLLTDLSGVWQVKFDERRCVAAVQRDNLTFLEVLDFGASRDGIPASQRGSRNLLRFDDNRPSIEEMDDA